MDKVFVLFDFFDFDTLPPKSAGASGGRTVSAASNGQSLLDPATHVHLGSFVDLGAAISMMEGNGEKAQAKRKRPEGGPRQPRSVKRGQDGADSSRKRSRQAVGTGSVALAAKPLSAKPLAATSKGAAATGKANGARRESSESSCGGRDSSGDSDTHSNADSSTAGTEGAPSLKAAPSVSSRTECSDGQGDEMRETSSTASRSGSEGRFGDQCMTRDLTPEVCSGRKPVDECSPRGKRPRRITAGQRKPVSV